MAKVMNKNIPKKFKKATEEHMCDIKVIRKLSKWLINIEKQWLILCVRCFLFCFVFVFDIFLCEFLISAPVRCFFYLLKSWRRTYNTLFCQPWMKMRIRYLVLSCYSFIKQWIKLNFILEHFLPNKNWKGQRHLKIHMLSSWNMERWLA